MKYTTIKIDSKVASRVKKYVKKKGMTIGFYVSNKLDHALKTDSIQDALTDFSPIGVNKVQAKKQKFILNEVDM